MTRFHFRLDRVLRWRSLDLAAEEAKLKRLMQEGAVLESTLVRIQEAIFDIPVQIAVLPDLYGRDLSSVSAYAQHLTRERATIAKHRREKQREITAQAEVHRAAKQRCQLLEELRSRRLSEWQRENSVQLDYLAHESYLARWNLRHRS
jgi:hypothetical protein